MATYAERMGEQILIRENGVVKYGVAFGNDRWYFKEKAEPGTGGSSGGKTVTITAEMILASCRAAGGTAAGMVDTPENIAKQFNDALKIAAPDVLTTRARAACLIGQCAEESGWFKTTSEYGGSTRPYAPYFGRGYIQCTHDYNYKAFGLWASKVGLVTDPYIFYTNPPMLADVKYAPYTAIWYFSRNFINKTLWEWCDAVQDPWKEISRAINWGSPTTANVSNGERARAAAIRDCLAVTPEPNPEGSSGGATAVIEILKSKIGAFRYYQGPARLQPESSGYTDCSGLMYWAFLKQTGKNIGTYTGNQYPNGALVKSGRRQGNEDKLIPGDLLFCDWGGYNPTFDHVEMYIGNGKILGHGGPNDGPTIYNMSPRMSAMTRWEFRRYV